MNSEISAATAAYSMTSRTLSHALRTRCPRLNSNDGFLPASRGFVLNRANSLAKRMHEMYAGRSFRVEHFVIGITVPPSNSDAFPAHSRGCLNGSHFSCSRGRLSVSSGALSNRREFLAKARPKRKGAAEQTTSPARTLRPLFHLLPPSQPSSCPLLSGLLPASPPTLAPTDSSRFSSSHTSLLARATRLLTPRAVFLEEAVIGGNLDDPLFENHFGAPSHRNPATASDPSARFARGLRTTERTMGKRSRGMGRAR